jgi:hypothetical protein
MWDVKCGMWDVALRRVAPLLVALSPLSLSPCRPSPCRLVTLRLVAPLPFALPPVTKSSYSFTAGSVYPILFFDGGKTEKLT